MTPQFAPAEWTDMVHLLKLVQVDLELLRTNSVSAGPELKSRMLRYEKVAAGFAARIQRSMA